MNIDAEELKNQARVSTADQLRGFIEKISDILKKEREEGKIGSEKVKGGLIELSAQGEAIVVGDIHGDLDSLTRILKESQFLKRAEKNRVYLIFLGDYGDRGEDTPEVYWVILKLKTIFPEKVILLRGNHEPPEGLSVYPFDLPYFLRVKYGSEAGREILSLFIPFFNLLPHALLVRGKYLMLHGGVPEGVSSVEDIANAHITHPKTSFLEQILWNDPAEIEGSYPSPRGAGRFFGEDVSEKVLGLLGVKTLIRSHQPSEGASATHGGKVLTLFSRKGPPYYNAKAAFLDIDLSTPPKDAYKFSREASLF